jgi:hypothetical protein
MKKHNDIGGWILVMAYAFFLIALFAALSLLPKKAHGAPQVDGLSLGIHRLPYMVDSFHPGHRYWQYNLDLEWNVSAGRFFWRNNVVGKTRGGQFRDIFWQYRYGYKLTDWLDFEVQHKSRHALDEYRDPYEVMDAYGIRIHFLTGAK